MKKHKKIYYILIIITFSLGQFKEEKYLNDQMPRVWALLNGTIHIEPGNKIDNGCIIIRDGMIEAVGKNLEIPEDATVLDMSGKNIYPGFIDSWVQIPIKSNSKINYNSHWNFKVHSKIKSSSMYKSDKNLIEKLHKLGFTVAHIVPDSGIFQGQTALLQLDKSGTIIKSSIGQQIAYEVDGWSSDSYPNSLLGVIALIRQTLFDATWYGQAIEKIKTYPQYNEPITVNDDLMILNKWIGNDLPFIFKTNHELSILRSINLANEFNLNLWVIGNGYEYRRISEIKEYSPFIILPLDFPSIPDISNAYQELQYSIAELKHWDMAPSNPVELYKNKIPFSITSQGLKPKEFRKNLSKAIDRGLNETEALAALTVIPAKKLGYEQSLGRIMKGYIANLTITDGNYFDPNSIIYSIWVGGDELAINSKHKIAIDGQWNLNINNKKYILELINKSGKYSGKILDDTLTYNLSKLKIEGRFISWQVQFGSNMGLNRFTGHILENRMEGSRHDDPGKWFAIKTGIINSKREKIEAHSPSNLKVFYPEGAYGFENKNIKMQNVLIRNTTLWTSGKQGKLNNIDILFKDGKVEKIGYNIKQSKGLLVIDGYGKHVTPGLIDCHSHSAAFSINEGTQSVTSEVRIGDVLNSDDITIYRELAGGLTMANILHGSANTIGGQNAVIKLRWGESPGNLVYINSTPGIKFALGENVKQANWGDDYTTRYPQTRMGVEQILIDAFKKASKYQEEWSSYRNNKNEWKKKIPPRKDLELDALVEIIEGKRQIHCHSYRQDEIIMLTRVAEEFGFTVGTFQHVLEGYKVADRLFKHGANASTFSDWWAYKYEVIDAIPYNGALMTEVGVNVSFNSDSRELARRMNTEAAKGIKYGRMSEEDALNLVTINPAIQLGIDKWVGSLEIGKDADFVIWSDHPLSTKAICEQTWIDGKQYFSINRDVELKQRDRELRKNLINKILSSKGDKNKKWKHGEKESMHHHHCLERP